MTAWFRIQDNLFEWSNMSIHWHLSILLMAHSTLVEF